MPESKIM